MAVWHNLYLVCSVEIGIDELDALYGREREGRGETVRNAANRGLRGGDDNSGSEYEYDRRAMNEMQ